MWVEAPPEVRVSRGLARDGEHLRSLWEGWLEGEDTHFEKHKTRQRADVVVDASGRIDRHRDHSSAVTQHRAP